MSETTEVTTAAGSLIAQDATTADPAVDTTASAVAADPAAPATETTTENTPPALTMPGKDATPEQWSDFYKQIGRPDTPEAYELPVPEGDDGAFAKQVAPLLHKNGITAAQAQGLAADWNAMQAEAQAAQTAAQTAEIQALATKNAAEAVELKTEWGEANDANTQFAKLAVQQFIPAEQAPQVINALESVLGYKETVKLLYGIGKGLGEADAAGLGSGSGGERKPLANRMYPNQN